MHHRERTFYQYALLNLAILQADYGCFSEAIVAMQEAVSSAREHNDMICLNYSLSWLYHFGKEHPEELREIQQKGVLGTDREALAFLKSKAKETSMWSLLSMTLLSEAKLTLCKVIKDHNSITLRGLLTSIMAQGESVYVAMESVIKASHLNVTKYVANAVGSQMAIQSSIFGRLGSFHINRIRSSSLTLRKGSAARLHFMRTSSFTAMLHSLRSRMWSAVHAKARIWCVNERPV